MCLPYLKFSDLFHETHIFFYLALQGVVQIPKTNASKKCALSPSKLCLWYINATFLPLILYLSFVLTCYILPLLGKIACILHLQIFFKKLLQCQTIWVQIWPDILFGLIWAQTVIQRLSDDKIYISFLQFV